jgi:ABC-type uncharacterized transport system involved in gliding motility auxiliary subunit
MAEETSTATSPKKIHRLQIGLNVLVQVVLVIFLAAVVNALAFRHYKRWDFSRDQKYALSDKTKRFLGTIKNKMRVTVFFGPTVPIATDVQNLLTEYQYAAKGKIDIENIDPERNLSRAKEMFEKYKVVSEESLVVIDYEGHNKTVKASEMAEFDQGNPMTGDSPRVTAFKGEQTVTSAMMDLVEGKKNTIGYVLGHKEPPLTPDGPVSTLKTFIENENIKFQELNLFDVGAIPVDLKAIIIAGPQYDFSDREMKLLRDFWDKQGRILLLIDPAAKTPKLSAFLNELGVKVNDDRLVAKIKTGIEEVARVRDVIARFLPDTPVTRRLADVRAPFLGGTSSITLEGERVRAGNIQVQPLAQAEKAYWGEVDYNSTDEAKLQFDPTRDHASPLTIAVSVEKGGSEDERVQMNSSRMVVVSNATFIQENALTQGQQALDFVSAAVNWLLSREQLIGIAPKVPKPLSFSLSDEALGSVRWIILVLLPLIPAVIGGAVWWRRRA